MTTTIARPHGPQQLRGGEMRGRIPDRDYKPNLHEELLRKAFADAWKRVPLSAIAYLVEGPANGR